MDLNGDGVDDLISGSWPGESYFFAGRSGPGGREYAKAEMIRHEDGVPVNPGGGIKEQNDNRISIAGVVEIEELSDGRLLKFGGTSVKVGKRVQIGMTGTACATHAADWDGDGDFDLITGDISGSLWLVENRGDPKRWSFVKERALEANGKRIRVGGDAGPFVIDFDGDGDLDLLSGAGDGSVTLFTNVGTRTEPRLAGGVKIVADGETGYGDDVPKEPRRGTRSKVCATDWNGDGRLDLLVGDYATQKPDRPEPTAQEKADHAKWKAERDEAWTRFREARGRLDDASGEQLSEEARAALKEEMDRLIEQYHALDAKLPPEYDSHGWVWVFLQSDLSTR